MPNIDITRDATDLRKHYLSVQMQQGRVLTDDDFNEAERLDAEDARRVRVDVIGPAGSPDDGFRLFVDAVTNELMLRAGTYYVGGLRVELEQNEPFNLQRDWLQQGSAPGETLTPAPGAARFDFLWLDVWQQPVTAVEDNELLEAALGGTDTSARVRIMRRARALAGVVGDDCATAWAELQTALAPEGTLNGDFELVPNATLRIEPDGSAGTADLCSPPVNGGYLGAENQAIRVQITRPGFFTWGFDNGAPLYRVELLADSGGQLRRIRMITTPRDQAHYPLEGQTIELLPWSAVLNNGQKNAELSGFLSKVSGGYNPVTRELLITTAPGNDTGAPPMPFGQRWSLRGDAGTLDDEGVFFYMRVWNRGGDTLSNAEMTIPGIPGAPVVLLQTGLQIRFNGTNLVRNTHWIIAVRPETPEDFVPWELESGRAPHGVRRWIAPLGIIQWPGGGGGPATVLDDCRPTFLPLTRIKGCCSYTVGDGTHSYGNFSRIQDAVNALPPAGGEVCVLAGNYDESVVIDARVNIRIHGCGPRTRVRAVEVNALPRPAFFINRSSAITLDNMAIESGPRSAVDIRNSRNVSVKSCLIQMRDQATIWQAIYSRGDDILIESNTIEVLPRAGGPPAPSVPPAQGSPGAPAGVHTPPALVTVGFATRGGIQLAGGSDRVRILKNIIRGGIWNGITLGSIRVVGTGDGQDDIPDRPTSDDPCDPCRPGDLTGEDDPNGGGIRYESVGALYDIEIAGNQITDMGLNGIGVVRYFDLLQGGDMIAVHGLHITDNLITRCVRRDLALVTQAMQFLVAYGGISLSLVSDLRILRNEIVRNGTSHRQPICGVFAIMVMGLQLDDNRILDNGPRDGQPVALAQAGLRGGVHVWMAIPLIEQTFGGSPAVVSIRMGFDRVLPAVQMRDNIIAAPLGRALTFFSLGHVVVARNRLVTEATTGNGLDFIATTILIGNFGLSNEWTVGLLQVLTMLAGGKPDDDYNPCVWANPDDLTDAIPLAAVWPTGKTLFTENQVSFTMPTEPDGFYFSSILLLTLDDLGMTDNQCEFTSTLPRLAADVLAIAGSVRMADNRLSETWRRSFLSAVSLAIMNTTTDNQSTHCMIAIGAPGLRIFRDNTHLVNGFCPNECERWLSFGGDN